MVQIIKKEWHQVSREFVYDLDLYLLEEIYPDYSMEELEEKMQSIIDGDFTIEQLMDDAMDSNVDIDWNHVDDDWWTDRKGGYEVTFEVQDQEE